MARLLFFDVIRILSVLAVVGFHVAHQLGSPLGNEGYYIFFDWGIGPLAVLVLFFVSGAVIERTYGGKCDYMRYIYKRAVRIYPAFWMSILIGLLLVPPMSTAPLFYLLEELSGFACLFGNWGGNINGPSWFVGAIMMLYLAYPAVSYVIGRWRWAIVPIVVASIGTAALALAIGFGDEHFIRWFPGCTVGYFALGVYAMKAGLYPKLEYKNRALAFASDLSFYVFLVHGIVGVIHIVNVNIPAYFAVVAIISVGVYFFTSTLTSKLNYPEKNSHT